MIYVSTGGFSQKTGLESANLLLKSGITSIELSGGKHDPYFADNLSSLSDYGNLQIHNYFPPPAEPFVFNLASSKPEVYEPSISHARTAIKLAASLDLKNCSFHAGFLVDPNFHELGKRFHAMSIQDRQKGLELFLSRVNELAKFSSNLGIDILIENNVYSYANSKTFDENPFLMTDCNECLTVMNETPENVSLLLDVAHLKVSAQTLGFSKRHFLENTKEHVLAYHLSDNDGKRDSNDPIEKDSWFWPYLRRDLSYYSLEVYGKPLHILKSQMMLAEKILFS